MITLGWLDTLRMTWWLGSRGNYKLPEATDTPGRKRLLLMTEDWEHPAMNEWGTVKSLLNKAVSILEARKLKLVGAEIETLVPGTALNWQTGDPDQGIVYIPIHTNPGAMLYEGVHQGPLVPGHVTLVGGNTLKRSIANHGDVPSLCLVLTLKPDQA